MKNKIKIFIYLFICFAQFKFAETIKFSGDNMSGKSNSKDTSTVLSGNAVVETGELEIKSEIIKLFGKDFANFEASGNVNGKSKKDKFIFSADLVKHDRIKKISEFFGNVKFIDTKNQTETSCEYALYNQETEVLILKFNVNIKQKEKHCKAMFANYNRKTSDIDLLGKPEIFAKNDTFQAERISINLDTEEIKLQGKVSGSLEEDS